MSREEQEKCKVLPRESAFSKQASKQATIWLNKKGHELFKEEDARN